MKRLPEAVTTKFTELIAALHSAPDVLAAVKKRGKLADIDDGNRPSILVNKKGARYGPFLL